MTVYLNGNFTLVEKAKLSPFDRGFLFADGVYEGIRTYNSKLFRYDDHLKRLIKNLNEIKMKFIDTIKLEGIIYQLIKKNDIKDSAVIYLQITRGTQFPRKHSFPHESTGPNIFITAQNLNENKEQLINGVKVITDVDNRWMRCDIKSISLLPAVLANQKAVEAGAIEAILIRNGMITEGTNTNFFAVKNNCLYTAPESNLILSGITRKVVLELSKKLDIEIKEDFINTEDLRSFDEFFITSTTKEITPVVQINNLVVNARKPGILTTKLQEAFRKLTNQY